MFLQPSSTTSQPSAIESLSLTSTSTVTPESLTATNQATISDTQSTTSNTKISSQLMITSNESLTSESQSLLTDSTVFVHSSTTTSPASAIETQSTTTYLIVTSQLTISSNQSSTSISDSSVVPQLSAFTNQAPTSTVLSAQSLASTSMATTSISQSSKSESAVISQFSATASQALTLTSLTQSSTSTPSPTSESDYFYSVSTLAGSGSPAFANGIGVAASFNKPSGIAVDSSGTVYVADYLNNRIRKISLSGDVTTLAGSGSPAFADGVGSSASFKYPSGLAINSNGIIYVADYYNHRIRAISVSGTVTTLAGSGSLSFADGVGSAASFQYPSGISVDSNGIVYVADYYNHRIRKITSSGNVTTLAGSGVAQFADGAGSSASFNGPFGVAVDFEGTVYVADINNNRIRKISVSGNVSTLAGSGGAIFADGLALAASFNKPSGVAVDSSGSVFVADYLNHRIRKISSSGAVTTLAGSGTAAYADGVGSSASFNYPIGVAVNSNGTLYVADYYNHRIRKITLLT